MRNLTVTLTFCCVLVACSTAVPRSAEQGSAQPPVTVPPTPEATPEAATDERGSTPADGSDVITVSDIPRIPEQPDILEQQEQPEKICTYERKTGTHRATRVCRTRAQIEQESLKGKQTFDELHRSQRVQGEY